MADEGCTLLACSQEIGRVKMLAVGSAAELDGVTITACRNTRCSEVVHREAAGNNGNLVGDLLASYGVVELGSDTSLLITFRDDGSPLLADGDVYSVTITSSTRSVLESRQWTATYATHHPNGEACSPECRSATLTP